MSEDSASEKWVNGFVRQVSNIDVQPPQELCVRLMCNTRR